MTNSWHAKAASLDAVLASLRAPLEPAFELAYRRALARECGCDAAYTPTIRGKSRQAAALWGEVLRTVSSP